MKREDFYDILPVHIDICKSIIETGKCFEKQHGECSCQCPFIENNRSKKAFYCSNVVESAKEFISLFEKDFQPNIEEAIDSTTEFLRENLKETEVPDNVHQPKHYKLDGLDIEVIDVIKSLLTPEQLKGYLHGNVIKYILRTDKKNGVEDLEKAKVYLEWLIEAKRG